MVNSLCSFHRINGVRIDSDSLLTYGISQSGNPFGTTGTTKLDMDLDICIIEVCEDISPHSSGVKPEKT